MNASKPLMKRRKEKDDIKSNSCRWVAISSAGSWVLAEQCPALRRHELISGFYTERENLALRCEEKRSSRKKARSKVSRRKTGSDQSIVVTNLGESLRSEGTEFSGHNLQSTAREER